MVEGRPPDDNSTLHARVIVSEGYFRVLGIPLRQGRLFSRQDAETAPAVSVINEKMARQFWPAEDAVGKRFKQVLPGMAGEWITVIGIAGNVVYNRDGIVLPVFYRPARQWYTTTRELTIRTTVNPHSLRAAVRRSVQSIDPTLPQLEVTTVEDQLARQDRPVRFQADLIAIFAMLAVILAATGLYGLMAYSVEQRRKEIGIRMALGSTRAEIARLVLKQGAGWGGAGMAAGIFGAVLFGRALSASLYGVEPADPLTLTAVTGTLAVVIGLASAAPALRAPTVALREE